MAKVIFVCLGNICRSPLAEGVFERYCKENGVTSIRFLGLLSGLATPAFDVFDAAACFNGVAKVNSKHLFAFTILKIVSP